MAKSRGHRIRFIGGRHGGLVLVPLVDRPFVGASLDLCPTCRVVHPCKTIHLWLEPNSTAIVSDGVLDDMKRAGSFKLEWVYMNEVPNPPPLRLGRNVRRDALDNRNRKITLYTGRAHV